MKGAMSDQEIVQQYADEGRLNELPLGVYVITTIVLRGGG